jgi:hypothetical protein
MAGRSDPVGMLLGTLSPQLAPSDMLSKSQTEREVT